MDVWKWEDLMAVWKFKPVKKRMKTIIKGKGILDWAVLKTQKTVPRKWFTEECLCKVIKSLQEAVPKSRMSVWFLHHDNLPAHQSSLLQEFGHHCKKKLLKHPPYSPDLVLCAFTLFPCGKQIEREAFTSDYDLWEACDD